MDEETETEKKRGEKNTEEREQDKDQTAKKRRDKMIGYDMRETWYEHASKAAEKTNMIDRR